MILLICKTDFRDVKIRIVFGKSMQNYTFLNDYPKIKRKKCGENEKKQGKEGKGKKKSQREDSFGIKISRIYLITQK